MSRTHLLRLFWIGAAAILVAAALVALAAVVSGRFDETDGNILATLGTALLAGTVATTGASLYEQGLSPRFGLVVGLTAPVWFALAGAAVWQSFDGRLGKAAVTGYVVLAAELLLATGRVLVGTRRLRLLFGATAACAGIATAVTVQAIWREHGGSGTAKLAATFWILAVLGYLLIPVARRLAATPTTAGPRRVDLARLVRRGAGEVLYVVVDGRARFDGLELAAGEAAVSRSEPELDAGGRVITIK